MFSYAFCVHIKERATQVVNLLFFSLTNIYIYIYIYSFAYDSQYSCSTYLSEQSKKLLYYLLLLGFDTESMFDINFSFQLLIFMYNFSKLHLFFFTFSYIFKKFQNTSIFQHIFSQKILTKNQVNYSQSLSLFVWKHHGHQFSFCCFSKVVNKKCHQF